MEMHERVRELRKNHLHISQAAFGEKLGVNRDVINNIENNRLAKPDQKLSLIKLMCKEFTVNEEWLLHGTPPMFVEPDTFSLDQYARERGATELEIEIAKAYVDLPQDIRTRMLEKLKNLLMREYEAHSQISPAPLPDLEIAPATASELKTTPIPEGSSPEIEAQIARFRQHLISKEKEVGRHSAKDMTLKEMQTELARQYDLEQDTADESLGFGHGNFSTATG